MPVEINLFEFVKYPLDNLDGKGSALSDKEIADLEHVLNSIWKDRYRFIPADNLYYKSKSLKQNFIGLGRHEIHSRNWIGTIHYRSNGHDYVINLLPKIFHIPDHKYSPTELESIFAHILWWLTGSEKQYYSSVLGSLEAMNTDLLEVMAYMFSSYTLDLFSSTAYNYYITAEEELQTVKGQIDFSQYAGNYARGNRHIIPCIFDSYQYDNLFNRIVKYVAVLLKNTVRNTRTVKNLEELLFILDEVEYTSVTADDCDKVTLNPIYTEFKTVLDNCRLFLSSLSVYKWKDEYSVFALLIPAEKLFQNFIFSTLKNNAATPVKNVSTKRPGRSCLVRQTPKTTADRYKMINDIVVKLDDSEFILFDTKYKKIYKKKLGADEDEDEDEKLDPKYNIAVSDVYQMVSYAVGSGISEIGLIYPAILNDPETVKLPVYEIDDSFTEDTCIRIHPFKVDIVHKDGLKMQAEGKLEHVFETAKKKLARQLNEAVINIQTTRKK